MISWSILANHGSCSSALRYDMRYDIDRYDMPARYEMRYRYEKGSRYDMRREPVGSFVTRQVRGGRYVFVRAAPAGYQAPSVKRDRERGRSRAPPAEFMARGSGCWLGWCCR